MRDDRSPFELVSRETTLRTHHFDVARLTLSHQGEPMDRVIEVHRGTVAVVATDTSGLLYLIRQFRIPIDRWTVEIPAGGVEPAEEPAAVAHRELTEETGLIVGQLTSLGHFFNAPGHSTQATWLFRATDCQPGPREPHGPEESTSTLLTLRPDQLAGLIADGSITDAKSLLGLQRAGLL